MNDSPDMAWARDASTPDYSDIRDDRINMFATATGNARHYYYVVRAVSTGSFRMGPVQADAMYNGELNSIFPEGQTRRFRKILARTLELVLDMRMAFAKSGRNRLRIYLY